MSAAPRQLLRRLEHQPHTARQFVLPGFEQPRRLQQHGRVQIMPAGMHAGIPAGKGYIRPLPDGQRIHIRPEQHALLPLADLRNDAAFAALSGRKPHFRERMPNVIKGIMEAKARFCMGMEKPPVTDDPFPINQGKQILHKNTSFLFSTLS